MTPRAAGRRDRAEEGGALVDKLEKAAEADRAPGGTGLDRS